MVLLLICAWDHCDLRLNTGYCGSILRLFIGGCCGGTGRFQRIGHTVMESWWRCVIRKSRKAKNKNTKELQYLILDLSWVVRRFCRS